MTTATPEELMATTEASLRNYLTKLKMEGTESSPEVSNYLKMSQESLQHLNTQECNEVAFLLNREAFHIQKERNILTGKIARANMTIDWMIGKRIDQYDKYLPYEKKRMLAVQDNTYCKALFGLVVECNQFLEATTFLTHQLKSIADTLIELARSKRSEK